MSYKIKRHAIKVRGNIYEFEINGRKYKRPWEEPYPKEYMIKREKHDPIRESFINDICIALDIDTPYEIEYITDSIFTDAEFDLIIPAMQGGGGGGIKDLRRKDPKKEYRRKEYFLKAKEKFIKECSENRVPTKEIDILNNIEFKPELTKEDFLTMMKEELFLDLYLLAKTGQKRAEELVKLFDIHPYYRKES